MLLLNRLGLTPAAGGKLDARSNALVSAWIAERLRVAVAPFDDRDLLGTARGDAREKEVDREDVAVVRLEELIHELDVVPS